MASDRQLGHHVFSSHLLFQNSSALLKPLKSANYGTRAKSSPLPAFVSRSNGTQPPRELTYCLWLLSHYNGMAEWVKRLLPSPLQSKFADS